MRRRRVGREDSQEDYAMASSAITTVILVRHADRTPDGSPDPPGPSLNDKGMARAAKLVHVLSKSGIQAIYASQYTRSKMTAKPFRIKNPGVPEVVIDGAPELKDHILTNHSGQTVLVVGHSDTVPELIRLLGGPSLANIDDCEFDNLFVLVRYSSTSSTVTKLKYGEPTSAPC
jgi:broad specificity phosphatase PhoE